MSSKNKVIYNNILPKKIEFPAGRISIRWIPSFISGYMILEETKPVISISNYAFIYCELCSAIEDQKLCFEIVSVNIA